MDPGGGGVLNKFYTGGSALWSNRLPYDTPFWQKRYPFDTPFIEKRSPFHIPTYTTYINQVGHSSRTTERWRQDEEVNNKEDFVTGW